jgi:pimeloyl-ACP methyl ester carboxylesterase
MSRTPRLALAAGALLLLAACGDSGVETERAEPAGSATAPGSTVDETTPPDTSSLTEPDQTEPDQTEPPDTEPDATQPDSTDPTSTSDPDGASGTLQWDEFTEDVETATLEVPVDYEDPDGPTIELFVARHLAEDQDDKIGSLLVNPGGPGFGGSDFAIFADQIYGSDLLRRFDIIGWDPRGTGLSEPAIDCIDDYDRYTAGVDITPDDDDERQQLIDIAEEFAQMCEEKNGDILPFIGTNNSARDMDSIRRALGEDEISYFGFSYGSELGATWATLFPETVRAAVLDGAADPNGDPLEKNIQQTRGFEATLTTYLQQCSEDSGCAFHNDGDAEGAFDALMAELDEQPIPSEPGRPDVDRGVALQGVINAMYSDAVWPQLSTALAEAQEGDGAGLLQLYDDYYQRQSDGTWGNELEAFQSISCMDQVERPTIEESDADAPLLTEAAPRIQPDTTGDYFCTFFPPSIDPRVEITGAGAGPIVVIGTTGDAATPLESTRIMADTLEDGRLVVVTADQHTGYGVNQCVDDIVHSYLIDLEAPPEESQC